MKFLEIVSIPDELIVKYIDLITDLPIVQKNKVKEQINNGKLHPKDAKMLLARTIVKMYHGVQESEKAEESFKAVFQKGALPEEIPVVKWQGEKDVPLVELLVELQLQKSKTEARKMIQNGGVRLNEVKVNDIHLQVKTNEEPIIQVGKRKFIKLETI